MIRRVVLAGCVIIAGTAAAAAFSGQIVTYEKVVAGGRTLTAASMMVLDPTCHSLGPMTIGLIDAPHNGSVSVEQGRRYPSFWTLNTRSRCNTRKAPATNVLYTPAPGYSGEDEFAIEFVGPLGNVGRARFHISVR